MSDVQRIVIDGEFTIFTASEIRNRMLDALNEGDQVEVDLSGVNEMDTAGVQIILAAQLNASNRHKNLSFIGRSQAVIDAMAIYGLADRFASKAKSRAASDSVGTSA